MTDKTFAADLGPYLIQFTGSPPPATGFADVPVEALVPPTFSAGRADSGDYSVEGEVTYTWDADFTPEQEIEWTQAFQRVRREREPVDDDVIDTHVAVLKQWRNRTGTATNAQRDAALDAMTELWRLTLKED